jgi:hypothetical protein
VLRRVAWITLIGIVVTSGVISHYDIVAVLIGAYPTKARAEVNISRNVKGILVVDASPYMDSSFESNLNFSRFFFHIFVRNNCTHNSILSRAYCADASCGIYSRKGKVEVSFQGMVQNISGNPVSNFVGGRHDAIVYETQSRFKPDPRCEILWDHIKEADGKVSPTLEFTYKRLPISHILVDFDCFFDFGCHVIHCISGATCLSDGPFDLTILCPYRYRGLERRVSGFAGSPVGSNQKIALPRAGEKKSPSEDREPQSVKRKSVIVGFRPVRGDYLGAFFIGMAVTAAGFVVGTLIGLHPGTPEKDQDAKKASNPKEPPEDV